MQFNLKNAFKIATSFILLIGLVSCLKSSSTDLTLETNHSSEESVSTSLGTTNSDSDIDEWLVPLLSNYLSGENTPPPESTTLTVRFSDENGYISDGDALLYMQSLNIMPQIGCGSDTANNTVKCTSTIYSSQNPSLITADSGSHIFENWSGVTCAEGQESKTCTFELANNTDVVAHYKAVPKVSVTLADASRTHSVNEINSVTNQIMCQSGSDVTCVGYYAAGSTVTLETEGTTVYSLFSGWSGVNCDEGQQARTCTFVVTEHLNISANYDYAKLTVRQNGSTTDSFALSFANNPDPNIIYVPSIYCDNDVLASAGKCEAILRNNLGVKLVLQDNNSSPPVIGFSSWSGVTCAEGQTTHDCTFTTQPVTDITLNFTELFDLYLTIVDPTGNGQEIVSDDLSLWCNTFDSLPVTCRSNFAKDSVVTLSSNLSPVSINWSGVTCSEGQTSETCTFTIQAETQVTATFQ